MAQEHRDAAMLALDALPASRYRDALVALAEFSVARSY
jgi:geranylgeranyl pyrophosphate synthase